MAARKPQISTLRRHLQYLRMATLVLIPILLPHSLRAQTLDTKIDLWVTDYKNMPLVVNVEKNDVGLTETTVRTRAELRLREAGIKPAERITDRAHGYSLYVFVSFNSNSPVYDVTVKFMRVVKIELPDRTSEQRLATTWDEEYLGYLGTSRLSTPILGGMDELLDDFLNAYLKANQ